MDLQGTTMTVAQFAHTHLQEIVQAVNVWAYFASALIVLNLYMLLSEGVKKPRRIRETKNQKIWPEKRLNRFNGYEIQ